MKRIYQSLVLAALVGMSLLPASAQDNTIKWDGPNLTYSNIVVLATNASWTVLSETNASRYGVWLYASNWPCSAWIGMGTNAGTNGSTAGIGRGFLVAFTNSSTFLPAAVTGKSKLSINLGAVKDATNSSIFVGVEMTLKR